jgi:hypothetical protein
VAFVEASVRMMERAVGCCQLADYQLHQILWLQLPLRREVLSSGAGGMVLPYLL